jgi:hypothetical protein
MAKQTHATMAISTVMTAHTSMDGGNWSGAAPPGIIGMEERLSDTELTLSEILSVTCLIGLPMVSRSKRRGLIYSSCITFLPHPDGTGSGATSNNLIIPIFF